MKAPSQFGINGVSWNKWHKKYLVRIRVGGDRLCLGLTKDFFEACCLRKVAELEYQPKVYTLQKIKRINK